MSTPDRRSFDSPRRGGRGRDRFDDFGGGGRGGRDEPYVPRDAYVPAGGGRDRGPSNFGGAPRGFGAPGGPETGATVKWFNGEKGFGFVELEGGGGDAFLHISVLSRAGYQTVSPGATLRVSVSPGQKGPQIAEVVSVDESTATPAAVVVAAAAEWAAAAAATVRVAVAAVSTVRVRRPGSLST